MKNNTQEIFNKLPTTDDSMATFLKILELPDEQFDQTYPFFKNQILDIYHSQKYQEQMLERLKFLPPMNIEEEKVEVQSILNTIDEDETLSNNKKEMLHIMFDSTLEVIEQLSASSRLQIQVKIVKLSPDAIIPKYAHSTDAGADVCAIEETKIEPGETKIVKTGIAVAIPTGYEIQIRPRSGLSLKSPLRIANAPATIDSDYRGEVGIIVWNTGDIPYVIDKGTKIAQLLIAPTPMISWVEVKTVEELGDTSRGTDGFGSTGSIASSS